MTNFSYQYPTVHSIFMSRIITVSIVLGAFARDPYWIVTEDDYCGREGPAAYEPRRDNPEARLESVQVLFRHGARGEHQRSKCFANDEQAKYSCTMQTGFQLISSSNRNTQTKQIIKNFESSSKACSLGQMLDIGYEQVERMSRYLRLAYGSLLKEANLGKVDLYSTDTQRTMGTLSVVLSSLFAGSDDSFVVNTRELDEDYFGLNIPQCKLHRKLRAEFKDTDVYSKIKQSRGYKDCASLWKAEFGTEFELGNSDDCLLSAKCAGVALPRTEASADLFACTMDVSFYVKKLKLGGNSRSSYFQRGKTVCRIDAYLVLKHLKQSVKKGQVGGLYAIHDETFACMLSALELWDGVWPKYSEFIAFEFYSDNKVRILRNGFEVALLSSLEVQGINNDSDYTAVCNSVI